MIGKAIGQNTLGAIGIPRTDYTAANIIGRSGAAGVDGGRKASHPRACSASIWPIIITVLADHAGECEDVEMATKPSCRTATTLPRPRQMPVMEFRSSVGPAIVFSVSKPSPAPTIVTVP
jgi:hypothetical protein